MKGKAPTEPFSNDYGEFNEETSTYRLNLRTKNSGNIELDLDATKYKETEIENNSNNRIHLRKDNSDIEVVYMYINPNEVDEESPLLGMMVKYTLSISRDKKDNLKNNGKNIQYYSNGLDKHVYVELMDDIHGYSVTSNNRLSDEELKELFNYKIKDFD